MGVSVSTDLPISMAVRSSKNPTGLDFWVMGASSTSACTKVGARSQINSQKTLSEECFLKLAKDWFTGREKLGLTDKEEG